MYSRFYTIALFAAVLYGSVISNSIAQDDSPVRITFDKNSKRIDIVSGKQLPNYTQAQRGSIRFIYGRIDTPEKGFWYFFDGRSFQSIKSLALIRKMPSIGAWAILGSGGWRGREGDRVRTNPMSVCEIEHHAVSFIPLNRTTGKSESRVYVLLDDLYMIQWRDVDHWVAKKSQEEFEADKGTMY